MKNIPEDRFGLIRDTIRTRYSFKAFLSMLNIPLAGIYRHPGMTEAQGTS